MGYISKYLLLYFLSNEKSLFSLGLLHHVEIGFTELVGSILLAHLETFGATRRNVEHCINHYCLHDGAKSAGTELELDGLIHDKVECSLVELQFHAVHSEELGGLAHYGVLWLGENAAQGIAVEGFKICENWQSADNLGYQTKRLEVLRSHIVEQLLALHSFCSTVGSVAYHMGVEAQGDFSLNAFKCTTADEENVLGVHRNHLLLGVLASALGWYIDHRAFEEL